MRSASRPRSRPTASIVSRESFGCAAKSASWYSQKRPWAAAASLASRGERRQRVALGDRQVAEGEDEAVAEPLAHPPQDRLGAEAEGALEVSEHDQLERGAALAADVIDVLQRG